MNKDLLESVIGIAVALVVAGLVALAGNTASVTVNGWPLFGLCAALAFLVQWAASYRPG